MAKWLAHWVNNKVAQVRIPSKSTNFQLTNINIILDYFKDVGLHGRVVSRLSL